MSNKKRHMLREDTMTQFTVCGKLDILGELKTTTSINETNCKNCISAYKKENDK